MSNETKVRSGLKTYRPGEIIFREREFSESLYIIQKGQVRLFTSKGKGFVEIGILRSGEVIGEMAYFDEKYQRRSCTGEAVVTTELIEISFKALTKTVQGLNPWMKTIINTLADRLRSSNEKLKKIEGNSVSYGVKGEVPTYKFFLPSDIVKLFSIMYLSFKSHGEDKNGKTYLHSDKIKLYLVDIINVKEIVFEEFKLLLEKLDLIKIEQDDSKLPKMIVANDTEAFRRLMIFINTQRQTEESKKIKISYKCEVFLNEIMSQLTGTTSEESEKAANISAILDKFKARKMNIKEEDLLEAKEAGFTSDVMLGDGNYLTVKVQYNKLLKTLPAIRVMNAIRKVNEQKISRED